ncbi:MAG: hypothetical protein IKJ65_04260 [Clostridia bacterium]|nr:hypothetical protein [Clostridia bacterium]
MAKKRRSAADKKRIRKRKIRLFAFVVFLLVLLVGWGYMNARVVHVKYADVRISNLSPFLEGSKILFLSDFNISSQDDAMKSAKLVKGFLQMEPDIIIFGGDYTAHKASDIFRLQSEEGKDEIARRLREARKTFFTELQPVTKQVNIYAVAGEKDSEIPGLYEDCMLGGVKLIENAVEYVPIKNSFITLVGYGDILTGGSANFKFKGPSTNDPVIAVSHNPDAYPLITSVMDFEGNAIADLALSGHAMGPQIRLFGLDVFKGYTGQYNTGVYSEAGAHLIVSSGVGTEWIPIRYGSRAEAHMITLFRK